MTVAQQPTSGEAEADTRPAEGLTRIEQVATRTGLTKRTLRYYEEIGLLDPPTRTEGGYRLYTQADVQRVERIERLRDLLGFTLAEIRDLVRADEEREKAREAWARETDPRLRLKYLDDADALVRSQLRLVDEKLAGLDDMRTALRDRLARYDELRAQVQAQLAPPI